MRQLVRPALTKNTIRTLGRITDRIANSNSPKDQAKLSWERKPDVAFTEIRLALYKMASGRSRCMYCEDSMGTDIDHFRPKANYPTSAFLWPNYLLACSYCNSNLKRQQFPLDAAGMPLLIDPSVDDPTTHLKFLPTSGEYAAVDDKGIESIRIFGLNDNAPPRKLPKARKEALISLYALLEMYDRNITTDPLKAEKIKFTIIDFPFNSILYWLVHTASLPGGGAVLGSDITRIIQTHRLNTWL